LRQGKTGRRKEDMFFVCCFRIIRRRTERAEEESQKDDLHQKLLTIPKGPPKFHSQQPK
jgi:hypothetical protein